MSKSDAGKGDTYRPVDRTAYEEGYDRAFGLCSNNNCTQRHTCYRWLKTPKFNEGKVHFPGGPSCSYYINCPTKKQFERNENA